VNTLIFAYCDRMPASKAIFLTFSAIAGQPY